MEKAKFTFELPSALIDAINELEIAVNEKALHIDCLQDEIRSLAHGFTDKYFTEEQAEEIIDYYCRRRWF